MAKANTKVEIHAEMQTKLGRREYIVASSYKFIIEADGVVSLVDADNELLLSLDHGKVFIASGKVKPVVESNVTGAEDVVTPIGEEGEDTIFHQHNVYEKLIAQTKNTKPSPNWRSELDEL